MDTSLGFCVCWSACPLHSLLHDHVDLITISLTKFSLLSCPHLFLCLKSHWIAPLWLDVAFCVIQNVQPSEKLTVLKKGLLVFSLWAGSLWMVCLTALGVHGRSILKWNLDLPLESTGTWQMYETVWLYSKGGNEGKKETHTKFRKSEVLWYYDFHLLPVKKWSKNSIWKTALHLHKKRKKKTIFENRWFIAFARVTTFQSKLNYREEQASYVFLNQNVTQLPKVLSIWFWVSSLYSLEESLFCKGSLLSAFSSFLIYTYCLPVCKKF